MCRDAVTREDDNQGMVCGKVCSCPDIPSKGKTLFLASYALV